MTKYPWAFALLLPLTVVTPIALAGNSVTNSTTSAVDESAQPTGLHGDKHHQHQAHGAQALKLNGGKKWATDAPLRSAMAHIQGAMSGARERIHNDTLEAQRYDALAVVLQQDVASMVSQCKLAPEADAQLHLVIAELMQGAEAMSGKLPAISRRQGAIQVMNALHNYATFFDDNSPIWQAPGEAQH